MAPYRLTIRFGLPKQQYHVADITANSLREALRMAAELFPEAAAMTADLAEVRRLTEPEDRVYGPE
jgi:hypothetical protein